MLELCLKIMLYNRKFIHLQCVFHSIRLRLRLTKIGCRDDNQFFHFKLFRFSSILSLIYYPRHSIRNKQWSIFFK